QAADVVGRPETGVGDDVAVAGALEDLHPLHDAEGVLRQGVAAAVGVERDGEVEGVVDVRLFEVRGQLRQPGPAEAGRGQVRVPGGDNVRVAGGEVPPGVVVQVAGQAELVQVVAALDAAGRLAGLLHRRQQQSDEDGDDGDHHQEFDQGEGVPAAHGLLR